MEYNTLMDLILKNEIENSRACELIHKYQKYRRKSFLRVIEYIDLSSCGMLELDPSIKEFSNLRHLCLIGNELTDLPVELSQLTNLSTLELQDNNISVVPPVLYQMPMLHSVYLNNNPIFNLPFELHRCIREPYPHRSKWY